MTFNQHDNWCYVVTHVRSTYSPVSQVSVWGTTEVIHSMMLLLQLALVCSSVHVSTAICGKRASPAYKLAEEVVAGDTGELPWHILRCFVMRMLEAEISGDESNHQPSLFLNCILQQFGVRSEDRYDLIGVDSQLEEGREAASAGGLLRPCIYQKMSCSEAHSIVLCRQIEQYQQQLLNASLPETNATANNSISIAPSVTPLD